jgi:dolichyl-phosphate-mannose-protein mannosyltransferase
MVRRHWPFALVLAAGALLRLACEVAYRPALFYSDSWGYLSMAHGKGIVTFAPLRPSGYPVILQVLHGLTLTTIVQHLAGLATATLVYATCRALGVRRWLATVAGALIALDAWAIALEQYVLAEAFFALALVLAVWASVAGAMRLEMVGASAIARRSRVDDSDEAPAPGWGGPRAAMDPGSSGHWRSAQRLRPRASAAIALGFAGLCLAAAALMRPVGLFAVPAWIIWLIWVRPGVRPVVAGLACLVVPLLVYSLAHAHVTGSFGLNQANGWFLYGRVGSIATCNGIDVARDARELCRRPPQAAHENQSWFMFNRKSPARRAFGGISADSHEQARTDRILGHFARQVIAERPGTYAKLVATDFFKYLRPGPHALHREDLTVEFPASARIRFDEPTIRRRLFPSLRTHAAPPASALRSYADVVHTSRPLIALLIVLGLAALVLGAIARDPRSPALFLTLGVGVGTLLGASLAAGFALRYLVPLVPQFAIMGALSIESLVTAGRTWRVRRAAPQPA